MKLKHMIPVFACSLALTSPVSSEEIKGESLARIDSKSSSIGDFGMASKNHARVGLVETNGQRRQAVTVIAFDLEKNPEVRNFFLSSKRFSLSFDLIGVTNAKSDMPALNVEYIGTFDSKDAVKDFWSASVVAVWENVLQATSISQTYLLNSTNLNKGTIQFDDSAKQYAVFRFRMADPTYMTGANRNYSLKAESQSFVFKAE